MIATHNAKKGVEMATILGHRFPDIEFKTLADYPGAPEPEETGDTYAENATIKAQSASVFTHEWSVADDAGLEIDAMPGLLGVHSKRFGGEELPFYEKMAMILQQLHGLPDSERGARFKCFVALAAPDAQEIHVFSAEREGVIAQAPSGSGGFGYDPIFWLPEMGCTMADLTPDQKHAVSHRGKVLKAVGDWIGARVPEGATP
ncbi:MAG: non-canonical purine NTP pyrophosphatase [Armatimonadetes bacterium]|nr:non-canonical purine NTP pyrophosphatase [Armatimonadota bacterium]